MPSPAPLIVVLASPRGFCAGVERACNIVERALALYGPPVYVRHEIVHNRHVVSALEARGAVFVDQLAEIPDETRPVVFSAHGVAKSVFAEAKQRGMHVLDATCPLVEKVHRETQLFATRDYHILLIGHRGHPEVEGTMGQVSTEDSRSAITLIETLEQARAFEPDERPLAYVTQTTLSLDDTREILECLQQRFPDIRAPRKEDICYATTNRQKAVKTLATQCEMIFVIGAHNSSNSLRLLEVARRAGCAHSFLIADEQNWQERLPSIPAHITRLGVTASASAPERLVQELIEHLSRARSVVLEEIHSVHEDVVFKMPRALQSVQPPQPSSYA